MFKNKLDRDKGEEIQYVTHDGHVVYLVDLYGNSLPVDPDDIKVVEVSGSKKRYIREDLIEDKTEESPMAYDGSYVQVMQNEDTTTIVTKDFTLIRGKEGHMWIVDKEGIRLSRDGCLIEVEQCMDKDGRLYAGHRMYESNKD